MSTILKYISSLLFLTLIISSSCYADSCKSASGIVRNTAYDFTTTLSEKEDVAGATKELTKSGMVGIVFHCPRQLENGPTYRSYMTSFPVNERQGNWQYLKLNDHLEGALKITDSVAGDFYPPARYVQMGYDECLERGCFTDLKDSDLTLRLKILQPFVGQTVIPATTMFTVYVTTSNLDKLTTPVYTISYGGTITVPQSCTVHNNQVISIDFGSILSQNFKTQGHMPDGFTPQVFNVPVQCSGGISEMANLKMYFQGTVDPDSSSAIASDNKDIAIQFADTQGNVITPNSGAIPFQLSNYEATVSFEAYPISATGKAPQEGVFHAQAYMVVDFN
ncbi:TPA: fimbrial protein [Citrobacter freundii]